MSNFIFDIFGDLSVSRKILNGTCRKSLQPLFKEGEDVTHTPSHSAHLPSPCDGEGPGVRVSRANTRFAPTTILLFILFLLPLSAFAQDESPDIPEWAQSDVYEVQQASIVDFVTDECADSAEIDGLLLSLAERLLRSANDGYAKPASFLGVGGQKVMRDDIYGRLRFPFQADHTFYKKNGLYDFPQKSYKSRAINLIMMLLSRIPLIRKEIYTKRIKTELIKPLQKVLERE